MSMRPSLIRPARTLTEQCGRAVSKLHSSQRNGSAAASLAATNSKNSSQQWIAHCVSGGEISPVARRREVGLFRIASAHAKSSEVQVRARRSFSGASCPVLRDGVGSVDGALTCPRYLPSLLKNHSGSFHDHRFSAVLAANEKVAPRPIMQCSARSMIDTRLQR